MEHEKKLNKVAATRLRKHFLAQFDEELGAHSGSTGLDGQTALSMISSLINGYDKDISSYASVYQQFDKQDLEAVRHYLEGRSVADANRRLKASNGESRSVYNMRLLSEKLGETCGVMYALSGNIDTDDTPENIAETVPIYDRFDELRRANLEEGYIVGMYLLFGLADVPPGKEKTANMAVSATRDTLFAKIKSRRGSISNFKTLLALIGSRSDSIEPLAIDEIVANKALELAGDNNSNMKVARQEVFNSISNELGVLYRHELDR